MFTILIRYQKTRREVLISAKTVEFIVPTKDKKESVIDEAGLLINHGVEAEKGFHLPMTAEGNDDFRDVFVMNENGQTVARYTL